MHGWGKDMADSKLATIGRWKLLLSKMNDKQLTVTFDIVHEVEKILIGDIILQHFNHVRLSDWPVLEMRTLIK